MQNNSNYWYESKIIYGLDVSEFYDVNGDGIGEFKGATAKLDYLTSLGITCIWLLPFYPSTGKDNGYDVTDYLQVDHALGTLEDFQTFVREAKKRNIRVLIDLVIHHTSNKHPWFIAATADKNSKYHNYYVWTEQLPSHPHDENIFPTVEDGVWQYEEGVQKYYHHKFYHFQPDLLIANPDVQNEIYNIIDFWLAFDIDGFRIDAATHLFSDKGLPGTGIENPGQFIEDLRGYIQKQKPDAILLAEADVEPDKLKIYIKEDKRFHLLFNFLLTNNLFLSFAQQTATAVKKQLEKLKDIASHEHFANFLRNHDELDLEMLSESERQEVLSVFAPDQNMRIYNRGIRRRLAPMLNGNHEQIKMVYSLLFSLPGIPLIIWGDEIGMGENLDLSERTSVRTPMQWNSEVNAGFSNADPAKIIHPVIDQGSFSYKYVNAKQQENDPNSLLSYFKKLIRMHKLCPEFSKGRHDILNAQNETVLVLKYYSSERKLIIVHNFSQERQKFNVTKTTQAQMQEFFADGEYPDANHSELNPFGFRWFEIRKEQE